MPYEKQITRAHPSCIIFLIDQSGSMEEQYGAIGDTKSKAVADVVNKVLSNLILRCTGDEVEAKYYFDIGVIGYHTDETGNPKIIPVVGDGEIMPIPDLADLVELETKTIEDYDGLGDIIEREVKTQTWVKPAHMWGTPMCGALRAAESIISAWIDEHPENYPPTVFNITDGEATDGESPDVISAARSIKDLATSDGNALVFNCHISSLKIDQIKYPDSSIDLPGEHARTLFESSSPIPDKLINSKVAQGEGIQPGAYGFVFNADVISLIKILNIGTLPSQTNLR